MALEDADGQEGTDADNHQWHKQLITTRQLSYQEDTRQWGVHHSRHHTRHTHQGEVLFRNINTDLVHVPKA